MSVLHIHRGPARDRPVLPDRGDEMNELLPTDPATGLTALAVLPSGRIVWPVVGGDGTDDAGGDGGEGNGGGGGDDQSGAGKGTDWQAEAAKWKSLARKHEAATKKLAAAEDADKSEIQRAADKAAAAEARARAAEIRADRLEIAAAKGIPATLAGRLVGETREELEADADELLKVIPPTGLPPAGRERPKESLRSGSAPQAEREDNDPTKLAALIPRG